MRKLLAAPPCGRAALLVLLLAGIASASQGPAHVNFALRALDQATPAVRAIVDPNLDAYLAGAVGPDIALTVFYAQLAAGLDPAGEEAHYVRTGQLITNMYKLATTDAERAFALGWLTHWQADCIIHPLVNRFGGYYKDDAVRHKHLEMFESSHVFNAHLGSDPITRYVTNPAAVPVRLVNDAFAATYPPGWTTGRFRNNPPHYLPQVDPNVGVIPPAFLRGLPGSAQTMQIVTQAMVDVHNTGTFSGVWASGSMYLAVKGPPPTKDEYKQLMNPLVIDEVEWEAPDRARGETVGNIVIKYTINDLRLFKAFATDWNKLRSLVSSSAAAQINGLAGNPAGHVVPDYDLDEGPGGYDSGNKAHTWPGNPTIKDLLVQVNVVNSKTGKPVPVEAPGTTRPWDPTGEWVPCPPAEPQTWGQWLGLTSQEGTKTKIWGGLAGQASLKIPVEVTTPDPLRADLRLAYADRTDKTPYGIDAAWSGVLGEPEPELSICFLVDTSGSMGGSKIREAIAAIKSSVGSTNDGKTEWAIVRFGGCRVTVVCGFTMDAGKVQAAADRLGASGDTPLSYGIAKATSYLVGSGRGLAGRLVVLADGQDNCAEHGSMGPDEASEGFRPMFKHESDVAMPTRASGGAR